MKKSYLLFLAIIIINFFSKSTQLLFVTSIPKSGTYLALKTLELLTNKKAEWKNNAMHIKDVNQINYFIKKDIIYSTHLLPTNNNIQVLKNHMAKGVFIYRDPRDRAISLVYWIYKNPQWWPDLQNMNFNNLLILIIKNYQNSTIIDNNSMPPDHDNWVLCKHFNHWLPWKDEKMVYTTQFEKLIGPKGGGNLEIQLQEIKNIAHHIGLKINDFEIKKISEKLFGNDANTSPTFREGKIGSWKKHFTEEHKTLFKEVAGQLLIDLNYEKDLNW